MQGINRLNYDLAVIINLYDKYLEWKQKESVLESTRKAVDETKKEPKRTVPKATRKPKKKQEELDLTDILNDLY